MSIYGSYLICICVISTFFNMIQKECKGKLGLGKLSVAYVRDLVTSKNLALLREFHPGSQEECYYQQQPFLEFSPYSKTFLVKYN